MDTSMDTIVIGSGIGGLACAAALSKYGHRVLVLEQHFVPGGLTQTFTRRGFTWDVGIHYIGDMAPSSRTRTILDWLCDGAISMAPIGSEYDVIHFPDGFEFVYASPSEALRQNLRDKFPKSSEEIDAFFILLGKTARAAGAPFRMRAFPGPVAGIYSLLSGGSIRKWWGRTTEQVLDEIIHEPKLRSVLCARWGDHGGRPADGSFAMHAMIMNHFIDGAYYPVGGARTFADAFVPVIRKSGGDVLVRSPVQDILITKGRATGVRLEDGSVHRAKRIVSSIGVRDTIRQLLPEAVRNSAWAQRLLTLRPSLSHLCLYLGFEGDIRAAGATAANHWFYESWDTNGAVWNDPATTDIPAMFLSFPSLKDPGHEPGERQKHTGEIITWVNWAAVSAWEGSKYGSRPKQYHDLKKVIEEKMIARFGSCFPKIAPLITYHELSTPLSMQHYTRRYHGASYGLETTARRFLFKGLNIRTPVKCLFLAGQDVVTPGITGAMMGGVLAAGAIDPRVFRHL